MANIIYMHPMEYVSPEYRLVHDGVVTHKMLQTRFEFDQQTFIISFTCFFQIVKVILAVLSVFLPTSNVQKTTHPKAANTNLKTNIHSRQTMAQLHLLTVHQGHL